MKQCASVLPFDFLTPETGDVMRFHDALTNDKLECKLFLIDMMREDVIPILVELHKRKLLDAVVFHEAQLLAPSSDEFYQRYQKTYANLKSRFADVPFLVTSSFATKQVQNEILECLGFVKQPLICFRKQFAPVSNVQIEIRPKMRTVDNEVAEVFKRYPSGSGVVFCASKNVRTSSLLLPV